MGTIQSRIPEKTAKNHARLTCKSPWKPCSITHLPFLSSNPKILKAFLKTLPIKTKPTKCPAKKKNEQEKRKTRGGEKGKSKTQDCCVTFKPKNVKNHSTSSAGLKYRSHFTGQSTGHHDKDKWTTLKLSPSPNLLTKCSIRSRGICVVLIFLLLPSGGN